MIKSSEKLDAKLVHDFPRLYRDRHLGPMKTAFDGFPGDGWYKIIRDLSVKLEKINQTLPKGHCIVAKQVKEKFGGLRFYVGGVPKDLYDKVSLMIHKAESECERTCEACGKPGESYSVGGWIKTLCPIDAKSRDAVKFKLPKNPFDK